MNCLTCTSNAALCTMCTGGNFLSIDKLSCSSTCAIGLNLLIILHNNLKNIK